MGSDLDDCPLEVMQGPQQHGTSKANPAPHPAPQIQPEPPPSAHPDQNRTDGVGQQGSGRHFCSPWCLPQGGGLTCPPAGAGQGRGPGVLAPCAPPHGGRGKSEELPRGPRGTPSSMPEVTDTGEARGGMGVSWGTQMCPPRGTGHRPVTGRGAEPRCGARARLFTGRIAEL